MPFTPFHMGPALALKALAGNRFSILMFGLAQVAIDLEPALGIALGWQGLHGWTHTYPGATVIAAVVLAAGRPLCAWIVRRWNAELAHHRLGWLASPESVRWFPAAMGAFIGTYSHVALDSLMHADMRPFAPFAEGNALLDLVSIRGVYVGCAIAGVVGVALWVARGMLARSRGR